MEISKLIKADSQNAVLLQNKGTDYENLKRRIKGICVLNLVFIFIIFVSRMTKLDKSEGKRVRYPVVAWSNLGLITILLISAWEYYVRSMGLTEWFQEIALSNDAAVTILGFVVILMIFFGSAFALIMSFKRGDR